MISGCGAEIVESGRIFSKAYSGAEIFNSQKEFVQFQRRRSADVPDMDFEKNSLLAVFLGKEASEGYGLVIIDVEETADAVVIKAKIAPPSENVPPQYLIKIGKTDKKARLELTPAGQQTEN
jgi:hypothetical protein